MDTGEVDSFYNDPENPASLEALKGGLKILSEADLIIGHNIINYDLPVLQKLFPWFTYNPEKVFDTLVASRLIWTNLRDVDERRIRDGKLDMLPHFKGRQSLEAWGQRLTTFKGDYSATKRLEAEALGLTDEQEIIRFIWATWSPSMQRYCEQDVEVTEQLYNLIRSKNYSQEALDLEHQVAFIIAQQERNGFQFDLKAAEGLVAELIGKRAVLEEKARGVFRPWLAKKYPTKDPQVPKRPNKKYGYGGRINEDTLEFEGFPFTPLKTVVFNPGSRQQIANRFQTLYGWKPKEYTDKGQAKVDETVLSKLTYPEAAPLAEYLNVQKLLGQVAEGDKAWLKYVKPNGRIHGAINPNGAVTGRATHYFPNIAQVPKVGNYYGAECRSLFISRPGTVLLGCDVSGLELRMLGHFMAKHDNGKYADTVVNGDVHWENVIALGLVPKGTLRNDHAFKIHSLFRDGTKTFIYGFLYGAGGAKVASIIFEMGLKELKADLGSSILDLFFNGNRSIPEDKLYGIGNKIKKQFLRRTPALKALIEGVKGRAESKGYLMGLDGRHIHIRSPHAALNSLLQCAGALICKQWQVEFWKLLKAHGLHNQVWQVAWVHDELQLEVIPEVAVRVGELCVEAISLAGEHFQIRLPLSGEYEIGKNWRETH
ncbi:MAG: hypothetical protein JKY49_00530 [Cohaesibacteraceae bacterium]|nr:hypothetical protein [Cohaesibacteraceae bacterium]MBL4876200.1 hypothetical protein [Cohaesibacteraceae bacterium]